MAYNRNQAIAYAHQWAYGRNPAYYDFDSLGGDCTNFVSQCLHAGNAKMNYTRIFGWFYVSLNRRSPAWSGVEPFYTFLTTNKGVGPYGKEVTMSDIMPGDIIQLSFDEGALYYHNLFVVAVGDVRTTDNILVATHTENSDYRPLSHWEYAKPRFIHILGAR